jgi:nitroreductase
LTVNKETIRWRVSGWPSDANVVLILVWNSSRMDNGYFASAETGCLVQNVYLAAVSLGLGTTSVGNVDSVGLRYDLNLPSTMVPLLAMPLGYPASPYPPASPNYGLMTGNLPPVQYSQLSFMEALQAMRYTQAWSEQSLGLQELSQLLWAAYGYTNITYIHEPYHRTTPSAYGIYPLVVYVSNATGTYKYAAQNHSVQLVQAGDRRLDVANACGGQVWAANAPAIFLVAYNSTLDGDGGAVPHQFVEIDAGCVVQQLLLEASARNLNANVVSNGLEAWNGTGAEQIRSILGLSSSVVPLYAVPVGHVVRVYLGLTVEPDQVTYLRGESLSLVVNVFNQLNPELNSTLTFTVTGPSGYYDFDFQSVNVAADSVGEYSFSWVVPNVGGIYVVEIGLIPPSLTAYDAAWLEAV